MDIVIELIGRTIVFVFIYALVKLFFDKVWQDRR